MGGDSGAAQLQTEQLEVAVLDRTRQRARKFGRVSPARIADLLTSSAPPTGPEGDAPVQAVDEPGVDTLAPQAPPPGTTKENVETSEPTDSPSGTD